jgi:hypothetical protein
MDVPALENEMLAERRQEESLERSDDPHILFEQMNGPSGAVSRNGQSFASVVL